MEAVMEKIRIAIVFFILPFTFAACYGYEESSQGPPSTNFEGTVYNLTENDEESTEWEMRCDEGMGCSSEVTALAVDKIGNLVFGDMLYYGVDCAFGDVDGGFAGKSDCVPSLWKYDADGNVIFHRTFASSSPSCLYQQYITSIGTDDENNIFIVGYMIDVWEFQSGADMMQLVSNGATDAFLCKLDPDGNFVWGVNWGTDRIDGATDLVIDRDGNLYVAGHYFSKVDFNPGDGEEFRESGPYLEYYLSKFSNDGEFLWVYTWEGVGMNPKLAMGSSNSVYILSGVYDETTVDEELLAELQNRPFRTGNSVKELSADGDIINEFPVNIQVRDFTVCEDTLFFIGDGFSDYDLLESGGSLAGERRQAPDARAFLLRETLGGEFLSIDTWGDYNTVVIDIYFTMQRMWVIGSYDVPTDLQPGSGELMFEMPLVDSSYRRPGTYVMVFDNSDLWQTTIGVPSVSGFNAFAAQGDHIYIGGVDYDSSSGIIVKSMPLEE
jgi:hypothetical protein